MPVVGEDVEDLTEVDYLYWVGCAGSLEDRAKKTTKAFAELLHIAGVNFAIMGGEENCTGDSARRLSRLRSEIPILAFTPIEQTQAELTLTWGVETFLVPMVGHTDEMIRQVDLALTQSGLITEGELVVIVAGVELVVVVDRDPPGVAEDVAAELARVGGAQVQVLLRVVAVVPVVAVGVGEAEVGAVQPVKVVEPGGDAEVGTLAVARGRGRAQGHGALEAQLAALVAEAVDVAVEVVLDVLADVVGWLGVEDLDDAALGHGEDVRGLQFAHRVALAQILVEDDAVAAHGTQARTRLR